MREFLKMSGSKMGVSWLVLGCLHLTQGVENVVSAYGFLVNESSNNR